jgi:hypothetical protein
MIGTVPYKDIVIRGEGAAFIYREAVGRKGSVEGSGQWVFGRYRSKGKKKK